ncbi:hypothetical protein OF83DRAFT_1176023 [Amylostereum chailletii]|nr:hypothetical protein OF83DRAFT_1176023 [Amylostereum chailletii]
MSSPAGNATASPGPPSGPVADAYTIVAPIFVGSLINWMLMGVLVVQIYLYQKNQKRLQDRIGVRVFVAVVFLLDIVQTGVSTHEAWFFMIKKWSTGDLHDEPWSAALLPLMAGVVSGLVQMFYAWRIWILSRSMITKGLAVLIALLALTQSMAATVSSSIIESKPVTKEVVRLRPVLSLWLAGSFVTDIFITACMVWLLFQAKAHTSWSKTQGLIHNLMMLSIQTGCLTVICAGIDLFLFYKWTELNFHLAPYTNSFMATLNSRTFRKAQTSTSTVQTGSFPMQVRVSHQTHKRGDDRAMQWSEGDVTTNDDSAKVWIPPNAAHVLDLSGKPTTEKVYSGDDTGSSSAV